MSTKTTFKRIALGTVAALATSLLTVVAAPSASAIDISSTSGALYNIGGLSTTTNTDGNCFAVTDANDVAAVNYNLRYSIVINPTDTFAITAGTSTTAVNSVKVQIVSGPAIFDTPSIAYNATGTIATGALAGDGLSYTMSGGGPTSAKANTSQLKIKLTGLGVVTVKTYYVTAAGASTPNDTFTITSASTCDSGAYSSVKSSATLAIANATAVQAQVTTGDETDSALRTYSQSTYLKLFNADKYGTALTGDAATGKYLTATATNGAYVGWNTAGTAGTAIETSDIDNPVLYISNGAASTYTPVTTTVTVKLNDVVIATKTVTFSGVAAKIVLGTTPKYLGINTDNNDTQSISYTVVDAAGNRVAATAVAGDSANNVNSAAAKNFYSTNTIGGTTAGGTTTTDPGYFDITGGSAEGASTTYIRVLLPNGTYVVSDAIKYTTVKTGIDTVTISTDKKTYAPGEIVTVTVSAKGSTGNPIADGTALGGTITTVITGLPTAITAAPFLASQKSVSGKWEFQYYASTTVAKYGVSFLTSSATTTTAPVSAAFEVATSGTSEIAQLVKVIGSLLTTFTKQITALIKALGKK